MSKKDLEIALGWELILIYIEIRKAILQQLFKKNELRFLISVVKAISFSLLPTYFAYNYIPLNWFTLPNWIGQAFRTGTVATGIWVLGHERSHFAYSDTKWLMMHQVFYCMKHCKYSYLEKGPNFFDDIKNYYLLFFNNNKFTSYTEIKKKMIIISYIKQNQCKYQLIKMDTLRRNIIRKIMLNQIGGIFYL